MAKDVSALPMRDGITVPSGKVEAARWAMEKVPEEIVGFGFRHNDEVLTLASRLAPGRAHVMISCLPAR